MLRNNAGHFTARSHQLNVDIDSIDPGAYFVAVTAEGVITAVPVIISRQ